MKEGRRGSSGYAGVGWCCRSNKWRAQISVHGKSTHLGYFEEEDEAARKYDEAAAPLGKQRNFPDEIAMSVTRNRAMVAAVIMINGKRSHLGYFDDKTEAASKNDGKSEASTKTKKLFNVAEAKCFAVHSHKKQRARFKVIGFVREFNRSCENSTCIQSGSTSRYKGVCRNSQNNKWRGWITIDGKKIHLGYFVNEDEAAGKYDEAAALIGRPLNFPGEGQLEAMKGGSAMRAHKKQRARLKLIGLMREFNRSCENIVAVHLGP
jgi:hypothetical protein